MSIKWIHLILTPCSWKRTHYWSQWIPVGRVRGVGGTGEEAQWENLLRASGYPIISQVPPPRLGLLFLWSISGKELLLHFAFPCCVMQQDVDQINFFLSDSCSDAISRWWILIITSPYFVKLLKFLVYNLFMCLNFIKTSIFDLWMAPITASLNMLEHHELSKGHNR